MKILLFMDVYIFGGCEKMLKEVSDQLIEEGHSVDLLLLYKSTSNTYLDMLNPKINIKYIWDIDNKPTIMKRLAFWLNVFLPKCAVKKVDVSGYDWVINFKDDYQTNLLSANFKCKKIAWVHNITEDYQSIAHTGLKYIVADHIYHRVYDRFLRTFRCFDEVVCVSKHAQSALEACCPDTINSRVIYNYVEEDRIKKLSQETVSESILMPYLFCYIGRLSAEKGVVEIVRSVCDLLKKGHNIGLLVIGEGYQLKELQEMVKSSGYCNSVFFLGTKENPYPYISQSDCILCASHKESFGLVVLESILLKRWVISTRCGGPEELIEDGVNGTLVSNYADFTEAMENQLLRKNIPMQSNLLNLQDLRSDFYKQLNHILYRGNEK